MLVLRFVLSLALAIFFSSTSSGTPVHVLDDLLDLSDLQAEEEIVEAVPPATEKVNAAECPKQHPKHVVLIIADDMGWADVGFHGSEIPTPNIDALASTGVVLGNYYLAPVCSPSRSEMLTGKYAIHTGMQHDVVRAAAPWGLPLKEKLLPQYLKQIGYSTHLVGKWHLGFYQKEYTPTFRGYDEHFGIYSGKGDFWDHTTVEDGMLGLDLHRNLTAAREFQGAYATDIFTEKAVNVIQNHKNWRGNSPLFLQLAHQAPHAGNAFSPLQAPKRYVDQVRHVTPKTRQVYAAMMAAVDHSVGEVVLALEKADMLKDTLIVFTTDNGGAAAGYMLNAASNYPLRGVKATTWEGGLRASGFVWSPKIQNGGRMHDGLMHGSDWLPTILSAVGESNRKPQDIDGFDQWKAISSGGKWSEREKGDEKTRSSIVHNIDDSDNFYAYRKDNYKLISGENVHTIWDGNYAPGEVWEEGIREMLKKFDLYSISSSTQREMVLQNFLNASGSDLEDPKFRDRMESAVDVSATRRLSVSAVKKAVGVEEIQPLVHRLECGNVDRVPCRPGETPCLFDIAADPCEMKNLAVEKPDVLLSMMRDVSVIRATAVKSGSKPSVQRANPKLRGDVWGPWSGKEENTNFLKETLCST